MDEIDKIFNTLDSSTDDAVNALNDSAKSISDDILQEVNDTIAILTKDASDNIITSVENIKKVNALSSKLDSYFSGDNYSKSLGEFLGTYKSNVSLINSYFEMVSNDFKSSDNLYKQIAKLSQEATIESLTGAGMSANVTQPIIKLLNDSITTGTNRKEVYSLLGKYIKGDKENLGNLERYIKQIGNDSISQFNSNYIQVISNDLGLKHYYYKGANISDTREFCQRLAGKYMTEADIIHIIATESVKNNGKGWHGMIKGTNWPNFKIYRGGWNCRHYLIPISKAVYEARKEKWYQQAA